MVRVVKELDSYAQCTEAIERLTNSRQCLECSGIMQDVSETPDGDEGMMTITSKAEGPR